MTAKRLVGNAWYYVRRYGPVVALFLAVWIVMNERFDAIILVAGLGVAVVALLATNRVLGLDYTTVFVTPWATLRYLLLLAKEMTLAAWGLALLIIKGTDHVTELVYESELTDEIHLFLLANAITLTPGTVAAERQGSTLTVIAAGDDVDGARDGVVRLERAIARLATSAEKLAASAPASDQNEKE